MVRAAALHRTEPVLSTTPLGTVDAAAIADVDGAGWVQPRGVEWSIDWWVGAEDRWHLPADEPAVRQTAVGDSPVVQTAMRVPGGDVVHRAYAARGSSPLDDDTFWDDSAVVVEIENQSMVPVALALVLRPSTLAGPGRIRSVEVEGSVVKVDGRAAVVLSRPVARVAYGSPGVAAALLAAGDDVEPQVSLDEGADGLEVALVVPLPHTATVRALVPRVAAPRRRWFGATEAASSPGATFQAPDHEAVIAGWAVHTRGAARVELGDPALDHLVGAAVRSVVLGGADHVLERADRAVAVTELLARSSMAEPLGPFARAMADAQKLNGTLRMDDRGDATAALLFSAAPLLGTGASSWEELLVGPVAKSVHAVRKGAALADPSTWASGAAALALVAPALRRVGQPDVADSAATAAVEVAARIAGASPSGAGHGTDPGDLLQRLARLRASISAIGGDPQVLVELANLARLGSPLSLADRYDEREVPSGALGYDPGALAARASALIDMAVLDGSSGPVLLGGWVDALWGRQIEAHGVATRHGLVSFAMRWHGVRPALLWEVERWAVSDGGEPTLTAPLLDPNWQGRGWSGEALLAEVEPPEGFVRAPAPSAAAGTLLTPTRVDLSAVLPEPPSEGQSFS